MTMLIHNGLYNVLSVYDFMDNCLFLKSSPFRVLRFPTEPSNITVFSLTFYYFIFFLIIPYLLHF